MIIKILLVTLLALIISFIFCSIKLSSNISKDDEKN